MIGTKDEIKSGMVVDFRNGTSALVVDGAWNGHKALIWGMGVSENSNFESSYSENLTHAHDDEQDIVAVYDTNGGLGCGFGQNLNDPRHFGRRVLWTRKKRHSASDYIVINGRTVNRSMLQEAVEELVDTLDATGTIELDGQPEVAAVRV